MKKIFDVFSKVPKVLAVLIFFSVVLWSFKPHGISENGWHLLIIFVTTIATIISGPIPLGAVAILSLATTVVTGTLSMPQALSGFNAKISWLILFALFIARSISESGLGKRIAYFLICKSKNSLLALSYTLATCELILSPAIPSAVARGGGIIYPILASVLDVLNKSGKKDKVNFYLIQVCFHSNVVTSTMTLTAMACNPLIASIASSFGINITWSTWFIAAIIPGLANLILMPLFLYYLLKPGNVDIHKIKEYAKKQLTSLKSFSKKELLITLTLIGLITFWILGDFLGISSTKTILVGFAVLLAFDVIPWDDVLSNKNAWGIFIWFSVLVMLSSFLVEFNVISWVNENIKYLIKGIDKRVVIPIMLFLFFYLHYFFVSATAYIAALFAPFLAILLDFNIPGNISVMGLAILALISSSLTHYTTAVAPGYFVTSGVKVKKWCKLGFFVSTVNIFIWLVVCSVWWKVIGWY
ncbi:MAG: DASS family sodium-coupled anion symporter [Rickettsiales bacterium]|nr:DASS family sodium-coupled anion symporter [Rickettsiales bacterium]